jgi:hypothetical protein
VASGLTTDDLLTIWGTGPENVWATGGDDGVMLHYDGTSWADVTPAVIRDSQIITLRFTSLWGTGPSDVWTVGTNGLTLHYDGTDWVELSAPFSINWLYGLWGTYDSDLWAVGFGGTILRGSH